MLIGASGYRGPPWIVESMEASICCGSSVKNFELSGTKPHPPGRERAWRGEPQKLGNARRTAFNSVDIGTCPIRPNCRRCPRASDRWTVIGKRSHPRATPTLIPRKSTAALKQRFAFREAKPVFRRQSGRLAVAELERSLHRANLRLGPRGRAARTA